MNSNPQCYLCSRFMSWKDIRSSVSWIPYGSCTDLEPPEEEYAHAICWKSETDSRKDLIKRTSWIKPNQTN